MMQSLKNWWNRHEIREQALIAQMQEIADGIERRNAEERAALEAKLAAEEAERVRVATELAETTKELTFRRDQDAADEAKRNGKEPWVEVKSAEFNDVRGIQIELDWNEAFVAYLRENGINARDDTAVVQKWLLTLYKELIERMEDEIVENTERHTESEYL